MFSVAMHCGKVDEILLIYMSFISYSFTEQECVVFGQYLVQKTVSQFSVTVVCKSTTEDQIPSALKMCPNGTIAPLASTV
jgi:hypothetical protein